MGATAAAPSSACAVIANPVKVAGPAINNALRVKVIRAEPSQS
jgi:hypothetical protein